MKKFLLIIFCFVFFTGCAEKVLVFEDSATLTEAQVVQEAEPDFDYVNNKFSFALNFPEGYEIEYLENDSGVLIKKGFEYEDSKKGIIKYKVEVVVLPFDNLLEFENLSEFIVSQYFDYSVEFKENGVFVDEGSGSDAIRHFFWLSDDKKIIYEAYLRCPSVRYNEHKEFFDKIVEDFEIF